MNGISRRYFLKAGAAAAGASVLPGSEPLLSALTGKTAAARLSPFSYADVELLDGPMLEQFRANHAFFLALDEDRLLKPFRQKAGLPAPGEDMGGWYSISPKFDPPRNMTGYIPGHSFGQYLSGLARAYAATGSQPTRDKVHRLVRGFAATVTEKFYTDYPLPAYTFDKINCGLIDAHQFAGDTSALAALNHATDAVLPFLPPTALTRAEMQARPHPNVAFTWDEPYTLPENLYLAYQRGAGARYRFLARRFLQDRDYFDPLAEGNNILNGLHAYSHVNALSSAFQCFRVDGSQKHLAAARNGFAFVEATQSFVTGGWGPNETFSAPGSGKLGQSLTTTHASFETPCGAYGHFKISRSLLCVTGDSRYGDSMERVLYNTILGAKPLLEDGSSFYYSDYNLHGSKFYHPDKWPCCSGTFPQITADYRISSYFHSAHGLYVNLYVPSRVCWQQNGARCTLTQRTGYPYVPTTSLELALDRPARFTVGVRIPAWAGETTRVAVNGKRVSGDPAPGAFFPVARDWRHGDRIEIEFAMPVQLQAIDAQHPKTVALTYGPLALFALGESFPQLHSDSLRQVRPSAAGSHLWLTGSDASTLQWKTFPDIQNEKYRLYHTLA
jgi:DUF1680 family protein